MEWKIKKFYDLTLDELYEICKARYEVFGCGQKIFQENDFDDIDRRVIHIFLQDDNKVVAYARLIPKGITYNEASIGRVLVLEEYRRRGVATELIKKSVDYLRENLNEQTIVLSAQVYASKLYESVGFRVISEVYDEVDIPHVKMKLE